MTTKTNTCTSCRQGRQLTNDEIKHEYAAIMDDDIGYINGYPITTIATLVAASVMLAVILLGIVYTTLFV